MDENLKMGNYEEQNKKWPQSGQHILAQHTDDYVIVYQAFNREIAEYAVFHQKFGGPAYKFDRMTWIKPSFLWMMYRSNWGEKENQRRILAILIKIKGFEKLLDLAYTNKRASADVHDRKPKISKSEFPVRFQWDPDHDPYGNAISRRAIQIGIKGEMLKEFNNKMIFKIIDITDFVADQRRYVDQYQPARLKTLITPKATIFMPSNPETVRKLGLEN